MEVYKDLEGDVIMRDATTTAKEVFAIPELLESILLELPMKGILFNQRVAVNWRNTIRHSRQLQRALYLEPTKEPELAAVLGGLSHRDIHITNLFSSKHACETLPGHANVERIVRRDQLKRGEYYCRIVARNPLLIASQPLHPASTILPSDALLHFLPEDLTHGKPSLLSKLYDSDLDTMNPSCTRMLLTQPPIQEIYTTLWKAPKMRLPPQTYCDAAVHGGKCDFEITVTRTSCCGGFACVDCLEMFILDHKKQCPMCGEKIVNYENADDPYDLLGDFDEGKLMGRIKQSAVRLRSLIIFARDWYEKTQGKLPEEEKFKADAMTFLVSRDDEFCLGTIVCEPDEWRKASLQAVEVSKTKAG